MDNPRSRQFVTFLLILGAVLFGMILAGGLEMTPRAAGGPATPAYAADGPVSLTPGQGFPNFADLAEAVDPAVVSVQATTIEERPSGGGRREVNPFEFFFGPRRPEPEGQPGPFRSDSGGSGFVVSADGLVVTNFHVVQGASEVKVLLNDREYVAEIRGTDPATDIALLKIDAGNDLTYLRLGDSDAVRVGEWVMAVGSPLRLAKSVTVGVVSAKGRALGISDISFENFIQTDAAINFGNSGGPLISLRGEVIGINTAINYGAENIGFSVPSNTLKQILPQLRESGRVRRGYLGIEIQNVDYAAAEAFGLDEAAGALVSRVVEGEPAARAGVRPEDIVLEVDGVKVHTTRDLIDYVSGKGPGASVTLTLWRGGKRETVKVELSERGEATEPEAAVEPERENRIDWLGIGYQEMSRDLRSTHGVPEDIEGVWITDVAADSPLYDEGVRNLSIIHLITSVNGRPVTSVPELEEAVGATPSGSRLRLYIRRFGGGEELQPILAFPQVP